MAIQNADAIQKLYVAYFNRPADYYGLQYWDAIVTAAGGKTDAVAAAFAGSQEYKDTYAGMDLRNTINAIYKNLFGHSADIAGLDFWTNAVQSNKMTLSNAVTQIASGAQGTDKVAYDSKVAAAAAFTNALDTTDEILGYSGAKANAAAKQFIAGVTDAASLATAITPANLDASVNGVIGAGAVAQTYQLTKGLDNIVGTAGNDVIIGSIDTTAGSELNTLSSIDLINGGAGIDTLKIAHAKGDVNLGSLSNVEIVEVTSAASTADGGAKINATAAAGVTDLNIVRAAGVVEATAGNTTNVGVSLKDVAGIGSINVIGGKNVNVATTDSVSTINVGAGVAADPVGAVVVSATGAAVVAGSNVTMGAINVGGGSTITVTQKATVNSSAIVADATAEKAIQGDVTIVAAANTTDVTVKQDAAISAQSRAAVAGKTEVATAKFTALKAGESVMVGGLTFKAAKDLSAADVAQAFANLSSSAIKPTQLVGTPATATSDTNGSSVAANGTFSGSLLANWSSSAASGDTVTFTARANTDIANLEDSSSAASVVAVTTTTQGGAATSALNRLGVDTGLVSITGGAALKNVTVDGYKAASGITGTNAALATVTLANGEGFSISNAAATLALNLTNVDGTVSVGGTVTKTVNASVTGDDVVTTLTSTSAEALNVSGTGNVAGNTTAGLTAATAINTSAMTAGTAEFTIADGTKTSYTGGAAKDTVTISNAGTAITKAVALGAGDDSLTLNGTVVLPTATLSGGEGVDTIGMNGASAAAMSANGDFAGKIDGFEKLAITDTVTTATTVNMANMDGIKYVVSNNSTAGAAAAVKEVFKVDFTNAVGANSITFDTLSITGLTGAETAAEIAAKFITKSSAAYTVTGVNGNVVTFEAKNPGAIATDAKSSDFVVVDADATTAAVVVTTTAQGDVAVKEEFTADFTTSGAIEDGDTIVFKGQTITLATGDTPAQIAAKVAAGTYAGFTTSVTGNVVTFTAAAVGAMTDVVAGDFAITNVKNPVVAPSAAVTVTTQGADIGIAAPTLTLDKMVNDSTLELVAGGGGVNVKMADASGTADVFNIVTKVVGGNLDFGTVNVAGVETIKVNAADAQPTVSGSSSIQTGTLAVNADAATSIVVTGNSHLSLSLGADAKAVATVDASALTGNLTFTANGSHVVTVTGGAGADVLRASVGDNAKADVLIGGAGNDVLYVGTNGAKLTGGAGNDTFIVSAASASLGNKEGNTYSEITDFSAGDLLQLRAFVGAAQADVSVLGKLTATLNESTATFSNFVDAAVKQALIGEAVWFNYKGDLYVVVDSGTEGETFQNGQDLIVKLTGINGDNLTFNTDFGTAALI
ncbi:beta strand repeat-containing protein [Massilia sp. X63]|uniref:beta strand repeat-containing protein n=1 Tax=Massilia sp. X63 TaxID=3237285 RepID=UPI0034DCFDB2